MENARERISPGMEMEIYGILHGDYICNVRCQQQGGRKILIA
jgi:hypothetical protein